MPPKNVNIKYTKLNNAANDLQPAYETDAGVDLVCTKSIRIPANNVVKIPTGVAVKIPKGYYGKIEEKSGYSLRNTLKLKAGIIDTDYTGEIRVIFQNAGQDPYVVEKGEKIAQLIIHKLPNIKFVQVDDLEHENRGQDGFGSTDSKN